MIVAAKVQGAVHKQKTEPLKRGDFSQIGLAGSGLRRYDHIAQHLGHHAGPFSFVLGEGDDVGGAILSQVLPVDDPDGTVTYYRYGKLRVVRTSQGA